jgi:hypothetical protein
MALWTTPTTWATNDVPAVADLNAELRDNPLALKKAAQIVTHRRTTSSGLIAASWVTGICSGSYDFETGVEYLIQFSIPYVTQSTAAARTVAFRITANGTEVGYAAIYTGAVTSTQAGGLVCTGLVTTAAGLNGTYTVSADAQVVTGGGDVTIGATSSRPCVLAIMAKDVAQ